MAKFKSSFVELDLHEAPLAGYTHGYLDSSGKFTRQLFNNYDIYCPSIIIVSI